MWLGIWTQSLILMPETARAFTQKGATLLTWALDIEAAECAKAERELVQEELDPIVAAKAMRDNIKKIAYSPGGDIILQSKGINLTNPKKRRSHDHLQLPVSHNGTIIATVPERNTRIGSHQTASPNVDSLLQSFSPFTAVLAKVK